MFSTHKLPLRQVIVFTFLFIVATLFPNLGALSLSEPVSLGWANIVAAALPMIMGAVQAGVASRQNKNRPTYAVPEAKTQALENQKRLAAMESAPGTSAMLNQIRQSGAGATETLKQLGGGSAAAAGGVSDIYAKELQALQGMQGNQQAFRIGQQSELNRALSQYGDEQNRVWDYNINQPYQQSMAAKSALTNAAMSNMLGGAMGALGTAGAAADNQKMLDTWNKYLGMNNQSGAGSGTSGVQMGQNTAANTISTNVGALPPNKSWSFQQPVDIGQNKVAPTISTMNWGQTAASQIPNYAQPNPLLDVNLMYQQNPWNK